MTGLNAAIEIYSTANTNTPILLNSLAYSTCLFVDLDIANIYLVISCNNTI